MGADRQFLEDWDLLRRVQQIYDRYVRDGKRPTRAEAEAWLRSEGWEDPTELLRRWGYAPTVPPTDPPNRRL